MRIGARVGPPSDEMAPHEHEAAKWLAVENLAVLSHREGVSFSSKAKPSVGNDILQALKL